jgi:hypothetical protein
LSAVEDLPRAFLPVTMARIAQYDTMLGDRETELRALLSFPAANRGLAVIDRPTWPGDEVRGPRKLPIRFLRDQRAHRDWDRA